MIRISRPKRPPAILDTNGKGRKERGKLCRAYARTPEAYRDRPKAFEFDRRVYGHRTVKDALIKAQHGKCCFCESKFLHVGYGDVEHFRPKGAVRQSRGASPGRPGYYWLAYEWPNLLVACPRCNREGKGDVFPLADASKRARSHRDDLAQEEPLLINPAEDDPEQYLSFRQEAAYAIDGNLRGKATIEVLGLNREWLIERRRERLGLLVCAHVLAEHPELPGSADARLVVAKAPQDDAEYAAMARATCGRGL